MGVHPCQSKRPFQEKGNFQGVSLGDEEILDWYFHEMIEFIENSKRKDKFKMIGECGLDYDRFQFADRDTQLKVFPKHFELSEKFDLPIYFHSRAAEDDFLNIISQNR